MQRLPASAPIDIHVSRPKLTDGYFNSIDTVIEIDPKAKEIYNECSKNDVSCPDTDYLAIPKIEKLILEVKNIVESMVDTRRDVSGDLNTIQELFEYGDRPNKILRFDLDKLKRWCEYWLVPYFRDYDILNETQTLIELMKIIDPKVKEREQQRLEEERRLAIEEEQQRERTPSPTTVLFEGFGGKKKYLSLKRSSRRNKSHRKNRSRRVSRFRVKKSYKNKKYIK
jgi:hypothetical protein